MNKMKKLLSVLLAVLMILSSMTVMASAAKANYKTVAELEALDAYSPYGQVTRLSTEERMSIVFDALDTMLAQANINPGQLFSLMGLSLSVDLRSVNALCGTLDNVKSLLGNWIVGIAGGALGLVGDLNFDNWTSGMTRENQAQLTIVSTLLTVLGDNSGVVYDVISTGTIDLGLASSALGDLDLSIIADLPGLIKGMIFPMLERWDDTAAEIEALETAKKGNGNVESTLNNFVKNLFKNDMSITTVKADANGTTTSKHNLPGADGDARVRYTVSGTTLTASTYATQTYVDEQAKLGVTVAEGSYYVTAKYILEEEWGTGDYVWARVELDEEGNIKYDENNEAIHVGENLKYYEIGSQLLPSLTAEIDLSTMSVGDLLYTFIPPVFNDMAPVVLNGSLKKILGGLFGVKYTYVGEGGPEADAAVLALPDASNAFFTEEQGEYLWEWSNYAVINGNHYYRFQDQIFQADLSNVNNYFYIINWNYNITGDFLNDFIPANDDNASDRLLLNVNDFLVKVAETVLVASAETTNPSAGDNEDLVHNATWTRPTFEAGNENLVDNIKALAQAFVALAPQHIFGSDYATNERSYVELMLSEDNDTVLTGIAAQLVDMIMPSMTLPGKSQILASNAKVGAILAAVVREFAAYLVPEYNYDALIYADFGTTTADPDKTFVDPEAAGLVTEGQTVSGYWLDVIMTMALDIGFEYIRAFADLGEDSAEVQGGVIGVGYMHAGGTYAAGTTQAQLNAQWEGMLDYIVDWALEKDYEWTWKMENLVNTTGLTIDLATAQDPWVKLDLILDTLLPVDEILTIEGEEEMGITELEKLLRYDLILGLVDLEWDNLINTLQFNGTNKYFRTANVLDQLAKLLKGVINGLFAKVGGGSYALLPSGMTDFDTLANQTNIAALARDLIAALPTAYANGLLDTVLPIVNFFLGWKTDPQVIADPIIGYSFRDGNDYAFLWNETNNAVVAVNGSINGDGTNSTKITFLNNSSGMLEKHRDTTVTDHEYAIQIKSITPDSGAQNTYTFTYSDGNGYVSPYETLEIIVGGTYRVEEAVTFTIAYDYIGKDGQAVGGTQYVSRTFLFSNQYEDANIEGRESGDESDGMYGIDPFKKYQFTEDIYTTVTTFQPSVWGTNATTGGTSNWHHTNAPDPVTRDCDGNITDSSSAIGMTGYAAQYFDYYQNRDGGWAESFAKDGSTSGKLYYAKSGVTAETEFPYGVYDMGQVAIKYSDDSKVWNIDYIYYNDYDIYDIYTDNMDNGYTANDVTDAAVYNEYNAAWKDIVKYATYPMMTEANGNTATDYVKTIQPYIPAAIERFEAAKEALEGALADANASAGADAELPSAVQKLQAQLALDDGDGEKEVNFQDYEYYEYFNYADLRTEARNYVKGYYAPEVMDTYYILNSGIRQAELENVIAAETNATKAAAIEATKLENDAQAVADSQAAHDAFVMPNDSQLRIEDMTARLAYYKTFLTGKEEPASHLQFLNLEIAHVEAQQLVEEDYTETSWEAYAEALAEAKAVAAGTAEYSTFNSKIYSAKYDLMVAYKNLLLKADSLIEAGGTADLLATIERAEEILAMSLDEIVLSDIAIEKGLTKEQALGHLIQGLGYYYVGEDGNTWNLYADSAYEYADNDRPNRSSNQAKVNAANNNLDACIKYFVTEEEMEPSTLMVEEGFEYADYVVIDTNNNNYGEYTGIVYGIDTLDQNPDYSPLATLDDALTTNNGDDYLVITENENGMESTGATIEVVDENGDVLETYVFVYFGDVDGDGYLTSNDGYMAAYYEFAWEGLNSYAEYVACDIDGDGMPSSNDEYIMSYYEFAWEGVDYQYVLAETAAANTYEWF